MKAPTETSIVRDCLAYLKLRGIFAFRQNTGCAMFDGGGRKRLVRFGTPGTADILGVLPLLRDRDGGERRGVFLAVECKTARGRLTPAQAQFLDCVRAAGGLALCVRSVGELMNALTMEGC